MGWQQRKRRLDSVTDSMDMKWSEVAQSCPTLCDPMDCSLPGFSVHGILQARVLEWVAIAFSRGSAQPRDPTQVSRNASRCLTLWATREAQMDIQWTWIWENSRNSEGQMPGMLQFPGWQSVRHDLSTATAATPHSLALLAAVPWRSVSPPQLYTINFLRGKTTLRISVFRHPPQGTCW